MNSVTKLDSLADRLESMGLMKEATSLDVVSNTLEKEAMTEMLKNLTSEMPELSKIRNKQQALSVVWDTVKKIGKDRVLEAVDAVLRVMSQQTPFSAPERVAATSESIRDLTRMFGYPALIAAVVALFMWLGKSGLDNLRDQISKQQQSYTQQLEQSLPPQ